MNSSRVRKHVYNILSQHLLNLSLRPTFMRRCNKYLATDIFPGSAFSSVDYFQVFHLANQMGNQTRIAYLKTLLGGWVTFRRVQSALRPCIFCMHTDADSLQHYAVCDTLWHAKHSALPPFTAAFDPYALFGLCPPALITYMAYTLRIPSF